MSINAIDKQMLEEIRTLAARWGKIVSQRAFGEDGPDPDLSFRSLEQLAQAASEGVRKGVLEECSQQQANKLNRPQPCPDCGKLCPTTTAIRNVVAKGTTIELPECKAHCPDCRRDFFPPTDSSRAGSVPG